MGASIEPERDEIALAELRLDQRVVLRRQRLCALFVRKGSPSRGESSIDAFMERDRTVEREGEPIW